jgi:hypothetical protein
MKRINETQLNNIVKRIINENKEEESLYSDINNLIDDDYSDMDPAKITEVLKYITKNFEAQAYRKRKGIGSISHNDVRKNWQR